MPLNLVKMCVGTASADDLEAIVTSKLGEARDSGREVSITTRSTPTRAAEIVDGGGSLYWVMRRQVECRQKIVRIEPFTDRVGTKRCLLVLDPAVVRVQPRERKPFQGWRYLEGAEVPRDLRPEDEGLPLHLQRELAELGLL